MNSLSRAQYIQCLADRYVMSGDAALGWTTATEAERVEAMVLVNKLFGVGRKVVKGAVA